MRFLLIVCLLGLVPWTSVCAADVPETAGTAALVNGTVITTAEYRVERGRLLRLRKKTEKDMETTALARLGKEALESLIGRELLCQESRRKGIRIQAGAVEAEVAMLRNKFPSAEEFASSLGKMGLTEQAVAHNIEQGMAIQKLADTEFSGKTAVTVREARAYYDSHRIEFLQPVRIRLSHILVAFDLRGNETSKATARKKIEAIHRRIAEGEEFDALAVLSEDVSNNTKGGDLGYYLPGQLGKSMEEAAFSLKAGQVSSIVEDRFGYHLLKVTERQTETVLPFENVKDGVFQRIKRERTQVLIVPYLKRLREAAKVEIHLKADD